jgi:ubiquinone/menaquinone biosynthesis C-methylase UbiE
MTSDKRSASIPPDTPWYQQMWKGSPYREPQEDIIRLRVDEICRRIGFAPGQRILDVACGQGAELVELACRGAISTGVDLSEDMLAGARRNADARGAAVTWIREDMANIRFDRAFDAVMLRDCIFGIYDQQRNREILRSLMRALRPGGHLLLEVYNKTYGMRHGIEGFLKYCEQRDTFEGVSTRRGDGTSASVPVTIHLMSAPQWRETLEQLGVTEIDFSTNDEDASTLDDGRILLISGRVGQIRE